MFLRPFGPPAAHNDQTRVDGLPPFVLAPVLLIVLMSSLFLAACAGGDEGETGGSAQDESVEEPIGSSTVDGGPANSGPAAEPVPVDIDASFEPIACPAELPDDYQPRCGTVTVPMDWQTGEGSVTLTVAIFASTAEEPASDPVVYLEGGPGGHALETLVYSTEDLLEPLLARGDVVVLDQRGAGLSLPRLHCPETIKATRELEDIPIVEDVESKRRYNEALASCRQRLIDSGVDLAAFNSVNNAHDIEAVRVALGHRQWNLFGVSYGTRLALEVMRQHPDGIRSVILDSVYPPEVDSVAENPQTFIDAYMKVARSCRSEANCASQGDLVERFQELVQQLQVAPERVVVTDFVTGETDEVYLTGDALVGIITQALYSPTWFSDLPELASDLERGRTHVAEQFMSQQRTLERYFSDAMFYAISCRDEISFADPAQVVDPPDPFGLRPEFDLASNVGTNAFETCEAFANGQGPPSANQPVVSDIPTLLLAGEFDPVTPVAWARSAAEGLSRGSLVVAPNASHGVFGTPCGMSVIVAYLNEPGVDPPSGCLVGDTIQFVGAGLAPIDLVEVTYPADPWGIEISTVRPEDWSIGSLEGDQYRQQSFLDPAQLFQLAGTSSLSDGLVDFIEEQWDVTINSPIPFSGPTSIGRLRPDELGGDWRRRSAVGSGVMVEWFETDIAGDDGLALYVILVTTQEERDALVEQVLIPALETISVDG